MTERRPHWDQELEQAVSAVLFDCYENGISEEQVYQVIAAVEDWHEKFVMHGAFRVLAERSQIVPWTKWAHNIPWDVRRFLEGPGTLPLHWFVAESDVPIRSAS